MKIRYCVRWMAACLLGVLAVSACSAAPASSLPTRTPFPSPTAAAGSLVQVVRGPIAYTISARGRVMSAREATLSFALGGLLRTLSIQVGSKVKQGDVLAELDAWDLESQVFDAQNDVDLLQTQLDRAKVVQAQQIAAAKADLDVAKAQDAVSALARDRMNQQIQEGKVPHGQQEERLIQDLTAQSALDKAKLDQAQVRFDTVQVNAEIPVMTENLKIAKAKLERLQARLEESKLRAPFAGVIVALNVQEGDNLQVYQKLGVIADPAQPILSASVFEDDLARVAVGQKATIKLDNSPDRALTGKVSQIGTQPILSQGKNAYELTITFDDPGNAQATIRQGADVSVAGQTRADTVLVPSRAIIREGTQTFVQVVRDGNTTRVPVQIGVSDGTRSVVLSGLQEGDTVKVP
jgi:RND family efflux transporter MFP subunit